MSKKILFTLMIAGSCMLMAKTGDIFRIDDLEDKNPDLYKRMKVLIDQYENDKQAIDRMYEERRRKLINEHKRSIDELTQRYSHIRKKLANEYEARNQSSLRKKPLTKNIATKPERVRLKDKSKPAQKVK